MKADASAANNPTNRGRKKFVLIIIILLFLLFIVFLFSRKSSGPGEKAALITYTAQAGPFKLFVRGSGIISPYYKSVLKSGFASKVVKIMHKEGDIVQKGELIAILESDNAEEQFNNFKDQFAQIIIEKAKAQEDLKRTQILVSGDALPAQRLETAKANYYQVNMKYEKMKTAFLKQVFYTDIPSDKQILNGSFKFQLRSLYIRSPIAGTIVSLPVTENDNIRAGAEIATVINLDKLMIKLYIDEADVNLIKRGQPADLSSPAYQGTVFGGVVRKVSFQPVSNSLFSVVVDISDTKDVAIKPGLSAAAKILVLQKNNVMLVPNIAIIKKAGAAYVKKIIDNRIKEVQVVAGTRNDEFTEIKKGVSAGDIILAGDFKALKMLNDGAVIDQKFYTLSKYVNE